MEAQQSPEQLQAALSNADATLSESLHAASKAAREGPGAAPEWARQLGQQIQGLTDKVQGLTNTVEEQRQEILGLRRELNPYRAAAARSHNARVASEDSQLLALPDAAGNIPAGFPPTRRALYGLGAEEIKVLLLAYGVQPYDHECTSSFSARTADRTGPPSTPVSGPAA
ncbi:hypothetical protein HXX76_009176 [Chlamydomonas incerta]|uniref:Uncharacterized protein n=1 Tax=Chlamydomonas incerta TaxID=51695 RepID=A0A835SYC2_CHLIN|nr:hypothetical protein HXX76_009176 [Chlamydomonas incerta]|eukprot:KAG2432258.1 hypothetical protein HXX76_009176 [Chlamydomonas incerta]